MRDTLHTRRFQPGTLAAVVLLHIAALFGLVRALAPDLSFLPEQGGLEAITIVTHVPEPASTPEPTPQPLPDSGAQGAPGRQAVACEVETPPVAIPLQPPIPIPIAASTGSATRSGAADAGEGTGAAGVGTGTGSGYGGLGGGGLLKPTKPVKIAGDINSAADYPTPRGGREIRKGRSVTIAMTVGADGRASNCRVTSPSPDPVADRITCELAEARFRFEPARDANGDPVPSTYGWRQRWF